MTGLKGPSVWSSGCENPGPLVRLSGCEGPGPFGPVVWLPPVSRGERRAGVAGGAGRAAAGGGGGGLHGDPGPAAPAPQVQDDPPEAAPELGAHEGVEHRVQAAVQVGQRLRRRHGRLQELRLLAGALREQAGGVHQQHHVVGQVARHEHRHHGQHHPHRAVPPEAPRAQQGGGDGAVADHHDDQRQEEAGGQLRGGQRHLGAPRRGVVREPELAHVARRRGGPVGPALVREGVRGVRRLVAVVEVEGGAGQQQRRGPHGAARQAAARRRAQPEAAARPHDGHVAVDADAGEQQRAAVQAPRSSLQAGAPIGHAHSSLYTMSGSDATNSASATATFSRYTSVMDAVRRYRA
ncbi:hypothetical protein EYF80_051890 [Liparis tanakae]|uniref:Uncharacterized protein n=1 Tax=Liparis tanakae TaxID=230148 RepID=A0A4Z2F9N0_9TELE|nr:hypothetical protein EYF80_051890 [Liparis tanakae]